MSTETKPAYESLEQRLAATTALFLAYRHWALRWPLTMEILELERKYQEWVKAQ